MNEDSKPCLHNKKHEVESQIAYLKDSHRFMLEITVKCSECGQPFQFLGQSMGLNYNGAAVSPDGQELRIGILPVGTIPPPLESHLVGFSIGPKLDS